MVRFFGLALGVAIAAATLALLAGPRPALADDTINVVSGSFPTAYVEVLGAVAERAGFYKEQHLIVTIQFAGNPSVAVQAIAAGKGDIASIGLEPIIQGYEKGVRMVAFLARDPHLQQVLGVLDNSPIHTLADFKGTTIGELTLGQPGEIYTKVMLEGAGLKPGDYSFAPIGNGAQAIQALTSGRVAGAAFPGPELKIYEVAANLKFRYFFEPIISDSSDVGYITTPATLASKADALRRFSRAIVQAAILCRVNPELAAKYFVESSGVKVTDQAIANEVRLLKNSTELLPASNPNSMRIGELPVRKMRILTKFMADNGLTTNVVPADAIVTDQFIGYANDFDHKAFIAKAKAMR
jgi:NitT/TauT family transport system substrate-binding protein